MAPLLPLSLPLKRDEPDRAYELHADEYVPDGIRRVARGQLDSARDELTGVRKRKVGEAVHETRKRIKRLRACVRLSRDAIGDDTYRRENRALRGAARELSAGRDAQVLLDTLDDLRDRFAGELRDDATAKLRDRLQAQRDATVLGKDDAQIAKVLASLGQTAARTPAWTFGDDDTFAEAISPGLRRIYRRGRKRMRAAAKDPSPENLHAWRKRVKDLWHATQIVRAAEPKRLKPLAKRAHKLADLLGDGHDLALLREYAERHPHLFADANAKQALLAVIGRREIALRDKALKRGQALYASSPKRFARRIERGWRKRAARRPEPLAG